MAHPDLEGWGICLAPLHRRLRDPAIASWMADTATTARPRSRRRSVAAADPVGSSPPDQREVLHHRGRGDLAFVVEPDAGRAGPGVGTPWSPLRTLRRRCAPHHLVLDPFRRKEGFGRHDPWANGLPGGESQRGP